MESNVSQRNPQEELAALTLMSSQVELEISPIVAEAKAIAEAVKDQPSYERAIAHGKLLKAKENWAFEALDPFCKFFKELHGKAVFQRDSRVKPCKEGQEILGRKVAEYEREENRKRQEAQDKLAAEQKKADEEARLNAASVMEDLGDKRAADQILDMPMSVPKIIVPPLRSAGSVPRTTWKAEVFDLEALVVAIAAKKQPIRFIEENLVMLNKEAVARKEAMNKEGPDQIPGVRAVSDTKNSFRE